MNLTRHEGAGDLAAVRLFASPRHVCLLCTSKMSLLTIYQRFKDVFIIFLEIFLITRSFPFLVMIFFRIFFAVSF